MALNRMLWPTFYVYQASCNNGLKSQCSSLPGYYLLQLHLWAELVTGRPPTIRLCGTVIYLHSAGWCFTSPISLYWQSLQGPFFSLLINFWALDIWKHIFMIYKYHYLPKKIKDNDKVRFRRGKKSQWIRAMMLHKNDVELWSKIS